MPFSRVHEAEADRIGLILMARACYDPRAALEVWTNMAEAAGEGPPEFLSTHPSHGSRIAALEGWLDEALAARDEANCAAAG
jgi:predicted Zn-dependent protease